MSVIDESAVDRFLKKTGNRGKVVLDIMGRLQSFQDAMRSPLFQEMSKDAIIRMDDLAKKILDDKATPEEKAKFAAYKEIVSDWAERNKKYERGVKEILKHNLTA